MHDMFGWGLALSFIIIVVLILFVWYLADTGKLYNPFGPFIRAFERWHKVHLDIVKMKAMASLHKHGTDPDYIAYLERENHEH